jgi:zinc protease
VSGSLKDVDALTLKDIADFHRKAYGAGDATLVVVGDLDASALQPAAERAFEKLGKGQAGLEQPFKPAAPAPAKQLWLVDRPGAVQSALLLAQPMPKRSEPGYEGRELLTTVFGGLFTSRLNLNLREEHAYTYGAHAQLIATQNWGAFVVSSSVRTDVTADAMKEALKELNRLRDPALGKPLNSAEISRGRADLVQSIGARLEYGARIGSTLSELWVHALPLDYYQKYPSLLAAETPESLAKTALTLDPDHLITVVVGDRAVIEGPLKALGYDVKIAPSELTD